MFKVGIGQDSHRIVDPAQGGGEKPPAGAGGLGPEAGAGKKPLLLGGIVFPGDFHLEGNSDADVVLHAVTNALSGITGKPILGPVADALCRQGIADSTVYLEKALEDLAATPYRLSHVSVSIECRRPKILPLLPLLREKLAGLLGLSVTDIGVTATTGEGLTAFGQGLGIQAFATATAVHRRLEGLV